MARCIPPLPEPVVACDPTTLILVFNTLHAHGRPMSESLLLSRLTPGGFKSLTLPAHLEALESGGQIRHADLGLWELTGVGL